jgi:hypothetical protein
MKLWVLLIFAVLFGTIAYALEPQPINRWVTNAYHQVTGTAIEQAAKLPPLVPIVRTVTVGDHRFTVEVADTESTRYRGLSGRNALGPDRGMLFTFPRPDQYGFTMRGMRFALDFVWVRSGSVIGVTENVAPPEVNAEPQLVNPPGSVDGVLELAAGTVQRVGIAVGQDVVVLP